jgi:hypothetical protein
MRSLAIVLVCIGCKGGKRPVKHDDASIVPADAAIADAPADAAVSDAAAIPHAITSDGVGPLNAKATDEEAFKKLLPGFAVKSEHRQAEAYSYDELLVSKDGKLALRAVVQSGKLFKIEVVDAMFAIDAGLTVGRTAGELAARMTDLKCAYEKYDPEGDAEHVDRALRCESQSLPRILFELDKNAFTGAIGPVAPKAIAARKIVEIVWLAPQE